MVFRIERNVAWAPFECVFSLCMASLLCSLAPISLRAQDNDEGGGTKYEGKTVEQWIADWDASQFSSSQKAQKSLAAIGAPAVEALRQLVQKNHRHSGYAIKTLTSMGPAAKPALPELLTLAGNKDVEPPKGWSWNMPIRAILFMSLSEMSWASEELIPVLKSVAADESETDQIRSMAANSLGGMGKAALPVLRNFLSSKNKSVRQNAANGIVAIEKSAGRSEQETRQEIINLDPFDENIPTHLTRMKGVYNLGRIHPPSQQIKQLYRKTLREMPDAQLAWQLAIIIRNGLANTDAQWATPTNSIRSRWNREDPDENYSTLASALRIAFEHSQPDSDLKKNAGLSLAKLHLLQGNWDKLNQQLELMGQKPIPTERIAFLTPPPLDWNNLEKDWQIADKELRSGTSGVEFRFLTHDKKLRGVRGVHVLVKRRPDPNPAAMFRGGIDVDTLFHATQPMLVEPYDSFGYRGRDRNVCRYGVSNAVGQVRFDSLPDGPMIIEILLPTANFDESGRTWDMFVKTDEGFQILDRRDPRSVPSDKPPYLVELKEGIVTKHPLIYIRPQLAANVSDWEKIDKDSFVLSWKAGPPDIDYYNVKLTLSAPAQHPDMAQLMPVIETQSERVEDSTSWPVGARGVGDLRLVPGNIYFVEVEAMQDETVVARLPRQRIWIPWQHRESKSPVHGMNSQRPAFYDDIWLRTNVSGKSLEERLPRLITDSSNSFETEYNRIGMAWLDLHKNKPNAKADLKALVDELPAGNVVRATAQFLLDASQNGNAIPKRLNFVGPK